MNTLRLDDPKVFPPKQTAASAEPRAGYSQIYVDECARLARESAIEDQKRADAFQQAMRAAVAEFVADSRSDGRFDVDKANAEFRATLDGHFKSDAKVDTLEDAQAAYRRTLASHFTGEAR